MKNQVKKSLSLLMAVLMILSCWVWVAPEKAEASNSNISYSYTINFETEKVEAGGGNIKFYYYKVKDDGTLDKSASHEHIAVNSLASYGADKKSNTVSGTITGGFPYKIEIYVASSWRTNRRCTLNGLTIGTETNILNGGSWSANNKNGTRTFEMGGTYDNITLNWTAPKLTSWDSPTFSPDTITLNKIGSSTNSTASVTLSGFKDQYGVSLSVPATFALLADAGITLGSYATKSDSGKTSTVTVTPSFQTLYSGKSSGKLYLDCTAGGVTKTATLTVNFPTYTITFDANGGKIGAADNDAKDKIEVTSNKMHFGSIIGNSPAHRAKAGFDFKGFYSKQNADATGRVAEFTGDLFKDNESTVPTQGDMTYYAAWEAKTITATFVTADNQLIGTLVGRYGNHMTADNMYKGVAGLNAEVKAVCTNNNIQFNEETDNSPIYKSGSTNYTFAGWKIIKADDESLMFKDEDTTLYGNVTFQAVYKKADATKYTVSFEDGAGNAIEIKDKDNNIVGKEYYSFRDSVINPSVDPVKAQDERYNYKFIGWAKKLEGVNFFAVDANDLDEDGVKIVYTSKDAADFIVKGNATYVPVFRMTDREYKVTFNYKVDGGATESKDVEGYNWGDTPVMPDDIKNNYTAGGYRYTIDGWKIKDGDGSKKQLSDIKVDNDLVLTATYGAGQGAEYTINFYGKAEDGVTDVLLNDGNNIYTHNSPVKVPEVPLN